MTGPTKGPPHRQPHGILKGAVVGETQRHLKLRAKALAANYFEVSIEQIEVTLSNEESYFETVNRLDGGAEMTSIIYSANFSAWVS
jgi:hypothetical protein